MYILQNSGVAASAAAALTLFATRLHSGTIFWLLVNPTIVPMILERLPLLSLNALYILHLAAVLRGLLLNDIWMGRVLLASNL